MKLGPSELMSEYKLCGHVSPQCSLEETGSERGLTENGKDIKQSTGGRFCDDIFQSILRCLDFVSILTEFCDFSLFHFLA